MSNRSRPLTGHGKTVAAAVSGLVRRFVVLAGIVAAAFGSGESLAATYYWDCNTNAAGFGTAQGTWAAPTDPSTTQGWSTNATGNSGLFTVTTTTADALNFGTGTAGYGLGSGTVTVSGSVVSSNITFGAQSGAITLSGGTIALAAPVTITVNNANNAIDSVLANAAAGTTLTKAGSGTLYLGAANTYTATNTTISGGVLVLNHASALPGTSGLTFNSGLLGLGIGDFTLLQGSLTASVAQPGKFQFQANGGWAAYGADRTVNCGGAGGFLGFGSGNVGAVIGTLNGKTLILGAADATHKILFVNGLDVGTATRTVQANDGLAEVDADISGVVRGAAGAGLSKTGNGTLALSGLNTITGPLNVNAGTVVGAVSTPDNSATATAFGDATLSTRTITVSNGATLRFDNANVMSHNFAQSVLPALNVIGGAVLNHVAGNNALANVTLANGALTATAGHADYGAFNLNGVITSTGSSTLSSSDPVNGRMMLNSSGASGVDTPTEFNVQAGALTVSAPLAEVTIESKISGLTKTGPGTLVLSGTNTYSGATTIGAGTLLGVVGGGCIGSAVTVNDTAGCALGVLVNDNTRQWTCASLTSAGANATLVFAFSTAPSTTLAPLQVTGALTFTGVPTIALDRANLVPGQSCPLIVCGGAPPGETPTVTIGRGLTASTVWIGNTLWLTNVGGATTLPLRWTANAAGDWDIDATPNWKDNTGADAHYTEGIVAADTVLFDDTYVTADTAVTLNTAVRPDSVSFSNSIYNYTLTGTGAIGGDTGLTKAGGGILTLSTTNTFSGGVSINGGTLSVGKDFNLGAVPGSATPGHLVINGGELSVSAGFTLSPNRGIALGPTNGGGGGTISVASGQTLTYGGTVANNAGGTGSLTKSGAGTLTLSGSNTFAGATTLSAGILQLGHVSALGGDHPGSNGTSGISMDTGTQLRPTILGAAVHAPITTAGAVTIGAPTVNGNADQSWKEFFVNGAIGGAGDVTFNSTLNANTIQTVTLNAANTYSGATRLDTSGGTTANQIIVKLGIDDALPVTTVVTIDGQNGAGTGRAAEINLFGHNQTLAGLANTPRSLRVQRVINPDNQAAATLTIHGSGNTTFSGNLGGNSPNFSLNALASGAANGNNFGLTKNGAGTFTLSGANAYSGVTRILGGILSLGNASAMSQSPLDTLNSAAGDANNGLQTTVTTLTLGGLTGDKDLASVFTTTAGGYGGVTALTLNPVSGATRSYSGAIADGAVGMTLTKTGAGTQILAGANSYAGATTVSAGTLIYNGSLSPDVGGVAVNGGILAGTGTIARAVTVNAGGVLKPGDPTGVLTVSNHLTVAAGATLRYALGAASARTDVAGDLSLAGTLDVVDAGGFAPGTYVLFNYSGALTYAGVATGAVPNTAYTYDIDTNTANQVRLVVSGSEPPLPPFDQWRQDYFGPGYATNPLAAAGADPLGKGMSNTNQFLADLDPTNAQSRLEIVGILRTGAADLRIDWMGGGTGAVQVLEAGDRLGDGGVWTNLFECTPAAPAVPSTTNHLDPGSVARTNRFYRIRAYRP